VEKAAGVNQDPFWEAALDMLMVHVVDLCKLAYGHVTVQQMYDIVQSLPKPGVRNFVLDNTFLKAAKAEQKNIEADIKDRESDERLLHFVDQFFESFSKLSEKTRSIIDFSFAGFLFRLLRDPVYTLFCRNPSTFTPEDCLKGKIIVLNLPVKIYH